MRHPALPDELLGRVVVAAQGERAGRRGADERRVDDVLDAGGGRRVDDVAVLGEPVLVLRARRRRTASARRTALSRNRSGRSSRSVSTVAPGSDGALLGVRTSSRSGTPASARARLTSPPRPPVTPVTATGAVVGIVRTARPAARRAAGRAGCTSRPVGPASSVMAMATLAVVRPAWSRVPVAVTSARRRRPVVDRVDGHTDRGPALTRIQDGHHRPDRLGEDDRGAAVEDAVGLGVALDGHRGDDAVAGSPR